MPSYSILRLGDFLVNHGAITAEQRDLILEEQRVAGRPFGQLAERMFGVSAETVERAWAEQYAAMAAPIDPRREEIDEHALTFLTRRQAWQFRMMPLRFENDELLVCTTKEHLVRALKFAGWKLGHPAFFALSDPRQLADALQRHFPMDGMGLNFVLSDATAA